MKLLLSTLFVLASVAGSQAATISFNLVGTGGTGLLGSNEKPTAVVGGGSGGEILAGITFDDVTDLLSINVGWGTGNGFTNLTGLVTAAHIHGPADQNTATGVLFDLPSQPSTSTFNTSASAGNYTSALFSGIGPLSAGQQIDLLAGNWYINVHTATNPGGEIRGNIVQAPIPEPSSLVLLLGALGLATHRRRS